MRQHDIAGGVSVSAIAEVVEHSQQENSPGIMNLEHNGVMEPGPRSGWAKIAEMPPCSSQFLRIFALVAASTRSQRRATRRQHKLSHGKQAMRSGHHLIGTARHKPDSGNRNPSVAFRQTVAHCELYVQIERGNEGAVDVLVVTLDKARGLELEARPSHLWKEGRIIQIPDFAFRY
ncbi:hypothetical protein C8R45DRAFT_946492 [Mycena sanguinolenta]|nr:hypothetical protein C8R45DRAFT_946492 [Mycena sanguinolenta]